MNRIRHVACILGGLALGMLVGSAPAFAGSVPPAAWMDPPIGPLHMIRTHVLSVGGMPGWQITLIALGAALIAATLTVIAGRARATHQQAPASTITVGAASRPQHRHH